MRSAFVFANGMNPPTGDAPKLEPHSCLHKTGRRDVPACVGAERRRQQRRFDSRHFVAVRIDAHDELRQACLSRRERRQDARLIGVAEMRAKIVVDERDTECPLATACQESPESPSPHSCSARAFHPRASDICSPASACSFVTHATSRSISAARMGLPVRGCTAGRTSLRPSRDLSTWRIPRSSAMRHAREVVAPHVLGQRDVGLRASCRPA